MLNDLKKQVSNVSKHDHQLHQPALREDGQQPPDANWSYHHRTGHQSARESEKGVLKLSLILLSCVL